MILLKASYVQTIRQHFLTLWASPTFYIHILRVVFDFGVEILSFYERGNLKGAPTFEACFFI